MGRETVPIFYAGHHRPARLWRNFPGGWWTLFAFLDCLSSLDSTLLSVYSQFEQKVIVAFKCQFQNSIIFNDIHVYLILKLVTLVYIILPCPFGSCIPCWNSETTRGSLMRPNGPKLASLAHENKFANYTFRFWCILCFKKIKKILRTHLSSGF